jgi:hypothetical protein
MNPTEAEKRRWSFAAEVGCVACIMEGELQGEDRRGTPPDIHHETKGNRTGHDRTAFLCPWHHRGIANSNVAFDKTTIDRWENILLEDLGPSLALHVEMFRNRYGSDHRLIERTDIEIAKCEARVIG